MQKQTKHNTALRVAKTGQTTQGLSRKWIRHRKWFIRIVLFVVITGGALFLGDKVIECLAEMGECAEEHEDNVIQVVPFYASDPSPGYPDPDHGDPHPLIPYPFGIYD